MSGANDRPRLIRPSLTSLWLPVTVGFVLCVSAFFLWRMLEREIRENQRARIEADAQFHASQIEADLTDRLLPLLQMARRWSVGDGTSREEFSSDAHALLSASKGFQAIEWVDATAAVQWVVACEGSRAAPGLEPSAVKEWQSAMRAALEARAPVMTSPVGLMQGEPGLMVLIPLFVGERHQGYILAVIRVKEWLDEVFLLQNRRALRDDCLISVSAGGIVIYQQPGWENLGKYDFNTVAAAQVLGRELSVRTRPTESFIMSTRTSIPGAAAGFGALLSILVASSVYLLQRAHTHRLALEAEMTVREKMEGELERAVARNDLAAEAGQMGIWSLDLDSGSLMWNERMFELMDVPPGTVPTYDVWRAAVHPEDRAGAEALLREAAAGRMALDTEYRTVRRDGTVRSVRAAARIERGRDGAARALTGLNWDITEHRMVEAALRKSESQVLLLLNSTGEAIYGIDTEGKCTFANPACARLLGYPHTAAFLGRNMHELIHHSYPDGRAMPIEVCKIFGAFLSGRGTHVDDEVLWRADGTSFPAEYWSYPQVVSGKVTGAVVAFNDITERKRAEALLAEQGQRLSYILDGTDAGTWEWNVQTGETVYNERWAEIIGYTLEELAPVSIETWRTFVHPEDLKKAVDLLERHFRGESDRYEAETRMRHRNGGWVWVLDRGKVATWAKDGKPLLMFGTHMDITRRKHTEETIRHLATHDSLTDLPTMRLARDRLSMALASAQRFERLAAVMFLDLDGFKAVNDTMGHDAGDAVLREVARRLGRSMRKTDTAARIGGDEFLLVLAEIKSEDNAADIATKIIRTLSKPIEVRGHRALVGVSVGIALYPRDSTDMDQLIKAADQAMYRVKASGKNGYAFAGGDGRSCPKIREEHS